jgi:predicted AAA+ superfamily ATPase
MKPWREIAIPHSDVLKGTFQQAEFAVDLTAVQTGSAPDIYKDAAAFFARTYITEGMRLLLTQVAQRLAGQGGEPVIQLQTAFGGGKTHTMLAVWHLAKRSCPLANMPGIPALIERAGLMELPQARVAVIDGNARGPGSPKTVGKTAINTLWGDLAWQLGGGEAFALVRDGDATGTSPGKDVLTELLKKYAPCVVLVDELVAYVRQFSSDQSISGGSYDSNLSFIQALTESIKQVPNAVLLASLPESEIEAGSSRGVGALRALEKIFGRVQAVWRPVGTEEGFEIVRRRLFEPIRDENIKNTVCKAFADAYVKEGIKLPNETLQAKYLERLCQAYPIHPELFDRLYEDWTTIEGFQRTRGVLKLMAKVIFRLWSSNNQDFMIMPGSLPLDDVDVCNELVTHLPPAWQPVIESEIDGKRSETSEIENAEPRFGSLQAARRVARTLFLGTAPASVRGTQVTRGIEKARILLGCLQPGQSTAVYSDALMRIADRLTYLNISGDRSDNNTRYWFDTRANLRREMEDRKRRFDDNTEVYKKIEECAKKLFNSTKLFDGVHVFTPHADVPDDTSLRLVLLHPKAPYSSNASLNSNAKFTVGEYLKYHGNQPRHRCNRLVFVAADGGVLERLRDGVRTALAWESIVDDIDGGRLNIDVAQRTQAEKLSQTASGGLAGLTRECFKWLLCPVQEDPHRDQTCN